MGRMGELYAGAEQDKDLTTVGGRLEWARKRQGLTQAALSKSLPTNQPKSRASIALYENGKPVALDAIEAIAAALNVDPRFLAFGDQPTQGSMAPEGQVIAVDRTEYEPDEPPFAILPRHLLTQLSGTGKKLELLRLTVDAPSFLMRSGDYMLVDTEARALDPDGRLYAVKSSVGTAIVRSEPSITGDVGALQITGGSGVAYSTPAKAVKVIGRVIASVQKRS